MNHATNNRCSGLAPGPGGDRVTRTSLTPGQARTTAHELPGIGATVDAGVSRPREKPGLDGRVVGMTASRTRREARTRRKRLAGAGMWAAVSLALVVPPTIHAAIEPARAPAADSPADPPMDTNSLETLTPAEAWKLVAEFPGVDVQLPLKNNGAHTFGNALPLNGLTSLDAETAAALAAYEGHLVLNGLESLDAEAARALAKYAGPTLFLDGLTTLPPDVAEALAASPCGGLSLDGVTDLLPATARRLAEYEGPRMSLDGLTTLDPEVAAGLGQFKGVLFVLNGLTSLDAETAAALVAYEGHLRLNGLESLDADVARALADFAGGTLSLDGLTRLDAATAGALMEFNGESLALGGLTPLDAETAATLAGIPRWDGHLPSLTVFDSSDAVAVAEALATREGPLSLPNLDKISPKTLAALLTKADVEIPPTETLELIPEPDGSPPEDGVIPELSERRPRQQAR